MVPRSLALATLIACGGGSGADVDAQIVSGSCDPDILKTGLVAQQTGISADSVDCEILKWTAYYGEPDPMIFKAVIYGESRFDPFSIGCTNLPCGQPSGWTTQEAGCLGLMQIVPACNGTPDNVGLLPNGHPDMTMDTSASGSIFYPDNNVHVGIYGLHDNRMQEKTKFSGCTEDQYTLMALGDYASYGSTKSCTDINRDYIDYMLPAYFQYASAAGYPAHAYQ